MIGINYDRLGNCHREQKRTSSLFLFVFIFRFIFFLRLFIPVLLVSFPRFISVRPEFFFFRVLFFFVVVVVLPPPLCLATSHDFLFSPLFPFLVRLFFSFSFVFSFLYFSFVKSWCCCFSFFFFFSTVGTFRTVPYRVTRSRLTPPDHRSVLVNRTLSTR